MSDVFLKIFAEAEKDANFHAEGVKIEIAEAISKYIYDNRINKSKMAKQMDISRQYLHRILRAEENLSILSLSKIALAMGVEVQILFKEKKL